MTEFTKLKELRTEHKLSIKELAEVLKLSPKTISKWESGKSMPRARHLVIIAQYFKVRVNFLLGISE